MGPMQKRGGGVAMVRRHPSAALSLASRKRQQFMAMPYHPLARFRGVDSPVISAPMIGPYRPSPPFALPLGVSSYGPRPDSAGVAAVEDAAEDEEIERETETGALSAGQLLSLLSAVARERGLGDVGRINKGLRFGMTRRR
ncbi:hypothetical protein J437_LFUL000288 [Ladona fulva]|uniref:Uncharacterized protein n=1 Tax=Ladona fulva TaxID=123851 RepID=A0A8K0NZA7_LADFU|nr:hypothetical protein J437_LFUL000288 [Ladona fulva]